MTSADTSAGTSARTATGQAPDAREPLVGQPLDRVDAVPKVTGRATYPADAADPLMLHAAVVQATVPAGRVRGVDTTLAGALPGVVRVVTPFDAPRIVRGPDTLLGAAPRPLLQDDEVHHHGQAVALVLAETPEEAREAANLVVVDTEPSPAVLSWDEAETEVHPYQDIEGQHGDVAAALAHAEVGLDESYETAATSNNPIGLFATHASWTDGTLTVTESTQWPSMVRDNLATCLEVDPARVRVLVPYLGGGFGAGLRAWAHIALVAAVSREVDRPVKLTLTRAQMFTMLGHRVRSRHRIRLGADTAGNLSGIAHDSLSLSSVIGTPLLPPPSFAALAAYSTPNLGRSDRLVRANIPEDGAMRAPGTAEGQFATETALDELAHRLAVDPVELRRTNFAERHPYSGAAWSSNALMECYDIGAELIGWHHRPRQPGQVRDGHWLVGWGMAGVSFDRYVLASRARTRLWADGSARIQTAGTDIGTGTYTILRQIAADRLGLGIENVTVELGDTRFPDAAQSGGSALATSLGWAVLRSCDDALAQREANPTAPEVVGEGSVEFQETVGDDRATAGAFAAKFAEVGVDPDLGLIRVRRLVTVVDAGRVLNEKLARSQIIGGTVMGIGQALLEELHFDGRDGAVTNRSLSEYAVPVSADVPDLKVVFVGGADPASPVGSKGVGEIGVSAVAPAVGNAVFNATGQRLRRLPLRVAPVDHS